jgi:restriction endonuclease S subunit
MTQLLERVLDRLHRLPDAEQDAIAAVILDELEDDARWQHAFEQSQDQLATLAQEALAEFRTGKTRELDLDRL